MIQAGLTLQKRAQRMLRTLLTALALFFAFATLPARAASFEDFIASLWPLADKQGVSRQTFDAAFVHVTLDKSILKLTRTIQYKSGPVAV